MKKAVAIILTLSLSFFLFACDNNTKSSLTETTQKISETVAEIIGHSTDSPAKIKVLMNLEETENYEETVLSYADTQKVAEIIKNCKWETLGVTCDCLYDFSITLDNSVYYYSSSCGTLEKAETAINQTAELDSDKKAELNEILTSCGILCCDTVEDLHALSATAPQSGGEICVQPRKTTLAAADFAFKMLKEAINNEINALISPVSLISALSMTANGAKGETLEQIEAVLGADIAAFNRDFSKSALNRNGVKTANSIWIKDSPALKINQSFIDTNKKHYSAEIFKEKFNKATLDKINRWVSDNTDGMIKNGLDEISADALMYLINTVLFDAEWKVKYDSTQVMKNQTFTAENGKKQTVTMLFSEMGCNEYNNFVLGKTEGIIRDYTNGYSFAALLPNEGVSIEDALNSFSGNQFVRAVTKHVGVKDFDDGVYLVETKIPKFEFDCSFEFTDTLKKLGMPLAFDPMKADFSGISSSLDYPLYISRVYHNTAISFTENGTKAGAATYVEIKCGSAKPPENVKRLFFDRPFIYVIYETDTGLPLFAGTVRDFEG